jgi:hypothetical protein
MDLKQRRSRMQAHLDRDADKQWVHQAANLDHGDGVLTATHERPILIPQRMAVVSALATTALLDANRFQLPERTLTPRAPYQASPLSYLNAASSSWSLYAETDRLEWAEFSNPDPRYGGIDFWFRDVTAGTQALITIDISASGTGPAEISVRSSDAAPRLFPIDAYADITLDLVVEPDNTFGVLVTLEAGDGITYLAVRKATYTTL